MGTGYIKNSDIRRASIESSSLGLSVYNDTGSSLAAGKLVYISGVDSTTGNPKVSLASPTANTTLARYVVQDTIGAGKIGKVARGYMLRNTDTSSVGAAGDPVYLTTSGDWTATDPAGASNASQVVGRCIVKSSTVGVILFDLVSAPMGNIPQEAVSENLIRYATGTITNAEMLALRASPKTLVAAPGAGKVLELISLALFFDYTAAYTETADNMAVKYDSGTGTAASQTIEATGFVDATADILTNALPKIDVLAAKSACENKALVLHNTGDGEYGGGNASNVVRFKVAYRVHTTGW